MSAMPRRLTSHPGYIALLSVLMVSAIAAMVIIMLFVTSLNITLNSGDVSSGGLARALADACAERALQVITDQLDPARSCSLEGTLCSWADSNPPIPPPSRPAYIEWTVPGQGTCSIVAIYRYLNVATGTLWRVRTTGTANQVTKYVEIEAYRKNASMVPPIGGFAAEIIASDECTNFLSSSPPQPIASNCITQ